MNSVTISAIGSRAGRRGLSKSRLLSSLQCQKRLWLEINRAELAELGHGTQARFSAGHEVGQVARRLEPTGTLIEWVDDLGSALAETRKALHRLPTTLFEAAFQHDGLLVRIDILSASRQGMRIKEVKSSTSVKDYHFPDAAIQAWVLKGAGHNVENVSLQHINSAFVYKGDGNYQGLFAENKLPGLDSYVARVPEWVQRARSTLDGGEPAVGTGKHCGEPFQCPFASHCSSNEPRVQYPISILPYGGKLAEGLAAEGYRDLREVPQDHLASEQHLRIWRASVSGKPEFDRDGAARHMQQYGCPRYFLDFETTSFAVPVWAGTRPYQALPFQFSCHIQERDGSIRWKGFLDLSGQPPMRDFLTSLLDALGDEGPIFAWNAGFEAGRLRELANMYQGETRRVEAVLARIADLLPIVRSTYYHPNMMGSWSLKAVLPAIAPELDYDDLGEIKEGAAAELAYREAISPATTAARKTEIAQALSKYCRRDTEALVRIASFLETGV